MACIVIIDDEDDLRRSMRDALEKDGHEVFEARNGREGLKLLEQHAADLVVTDIMMPETDGIETIIALRRKNAAIRIIAISGGGRIGHTDFLALAQKFGATHLLAKPFRRQQLLDAVRAGLAADA
jgi:CheY-like chemotaxis protein